MEFLVLESLLFALTTLFFTRRRKDGRILFAAALAGSLAVGWAGFRLLQLVTTEDTGTALFFSYLVLIGPLSGLVGGWMAVGVGVALSRRRRAGAVLGTAAGLLAIPLSLLFWSSCFFEPSIRGTALPDILVWSVALCGGAGAVLGGRLDAWPGRRAGWLAAFMAAAVLILDGTRLHAIRDHITPVSTLLAHGDVAALRAKADESLAVGSVWDGKGSQMDGWPEAPRPVVAYAKADPLAAVHHRSERVRRAAVRALAGRKDRRDLPVLRTMLFDAAGGDLAARALGQMRDVPSVPALERAAVMYGGGNVNAPFVTALGAIGGADAEAALARLASSPGFPARTIAVQALQGSRRPASRSIVRRYEARQFAALRGTPSRAFVDAVRALSTLKPPGWRQAIRRYHQRLVRDACSTDSTLRKRSDALLMAENTLESWRLGRQIDARRYPGRGIDH